MRFSKNTLRDLKKLWSGRRWCLRALQAWSFRAKGLPASVAQTEPSPPCSWDWPLLDPAHKSGTDYWFPGISTPLIQDKGKQKSKLNIAKKFRWCWQVTINTESIPYMLTKLERYHDRFAESRISKNRYNWLPHTDPPPHLSHKHMKTIVQFLRSVACLCFINHFGELLLAPFTIPRKSSPLYCLQTFWAALKFLGIGWHVEDKSQLGDSDCLSNQPKCGRP